MITANQVTLVRLIPMPVLCWLVYQNQIWLTLVLGVLIGCTDFVDGYLARKHGPTILGGLLDPMADKVFIAFAYFPFADPELGWVPAWAVALMFVREFLVTGLRSAYEQRGLTLRTSYFAKVKTWVQMQGIGTILLFILLRENRAVMFALIIAMIAAPLVAMAILWLVRRKLWTGAVIMSAAGVPFLLLLAYTGVDVVVEVAMIAIVVVTWLSGLDYIMVGLRQLRGRGDFNRADAVRLVGAVVMPCMIFATLVLTSMAAWPLVALLAIELSVGGLDNLLSHHRAAAGAAAWGARALGASVLLALALILDGSIAPWYIDGLGVLAAVLSAAGVAREFWRGRDYYMGAVRQDDVIQQKLSADL